MYTKAAAAHAGCVLGVALVACNLFVGDLVAEEHDVTVAYHVSTEGLDLGTPAGAHELYRRLKNAAWIVCNQTGRVDLEPSPNADACAEHSLAEAVRSIHVPLLVQAYLESHSLKQAAAQGIKVSLQVAAE